MKKVVVIFLSLVLIFTLSSLALAGTRGDYNSDGETDYDSNRDREEMLDEVPDADCGPLISEETKEDVVRTLAIIYGSPPVPANDGTGADLVP